MNLIPSLSSEIEAPKILKLIVIVILSSEDIHNISIYNWSVGVTRERIFSSHWKSCPDCCLRGRL